MGWERNILDHEVVKRGKLLETAESKLGNLMEYRNEKKKRKNSKARNLNEMSETMKDTEPKEKEEEKWDPFIWMV